MKSSKKILIGVLIVISFVLGFFIGMTIDYPPTDNTKLAGTIGKMNNYRNVKVTENDIKLRSDLLSNEALLKSYRQFFSFHYSSSVKLCNDIDFAIKAAENIPLFREDYSMEISNLKQFRETLEQSRKDILLALASLLQVTEADENNLALLVNNANIAIAQIKYKQNDLLVFVESIEKFFTTNSPSQFSDLSKAHDLLAVNQIFIAAVTNDKPMLKFYNKKQFFSSTENLVGIDYEVQNIAFLKDINDLKSEQNYSVDQLKSLDNDLKGVVDLKTNEINTAIEKLNTDMQYSSGKPGSLDAATDVKGVEQLLNTDGIDNYEDLKGTVGYE